MFARLFAESGLSLDRLKALVEVGAAGSIVKAADGDPVKQSQYSRQIKELEDFFRVKLLERRLHELTLDFGVIRSGTISRPLQIQELGEWGLKLWVPKALHRTEASAAQALKEKKLPLVLAVKELDLFSLAPLKDNEPRLACDNFLEALAALEGEGLAAVLPDFLSPVQRSKALLQVRVPALDSHRFHFRLAWNPRLLRLNPHASRRRDFLAESLTKQMNSNSTNSLRRS